MTINRLLHLIKENVYKLPLTRTPTSRQRKVCGATEGKLQGERNIVTVIPFLSNEIKNNGKETY